MSKKEKFIELVKRLMDEANFNWDNEQFDDARDFWNGLQASGDSGKPKFTENGKLVLRYIQENKDTYNNLFKAKDIGEGLGISSRTASGAMRKLVSDGYIEKIGEAPTVYALTELGSKVNVDAE